MAQLPQLPLLQLPIPCILDNNHSLLLLPLHDYFLLGIFYFLAPDVQGALFPLDDILPVCYAHFDEGLQLNDMLFAPPQHPLGQHYLSKPLYFLNCMLFSEVLSSNFNHLVETLDFGNSFGDSPPFVFGQEHSGAGLDRDY